MYTIQMCAGHCDDTVDDIASIPSAVLLSPSHLLHSVSGGKQLHTHANRQAPRCLPCNYTDPGESFWEGLPDQYIAPRVSALDAVLCCIVLCCAVLCCAVLCHAVLCCDEEEEDFYKLLPIFTSFCQPTRLITCANYGNHVQIFMKSIQSMT